MKRSYLTSLVATIFLVGCSNEHLSPLETALDRIIGYGSVDAHFCTQAPAPAQQQLKYLFIVDRAASNQPGVPNPLTPNVQMNQDSSGALRFGPIIKFVNDLVGNTNTSFGLIDFSDEATQPGNLNNLAGFDSNPTDFISIVTKDWLGYSKDPINPQPKDAGFTDFVKPLNLASQLIQQDAKVNAALKGVVTTYVIIFLSDGQPITATPNDANSPIYLQTFNADIQPAINSIMSLKNDPTFGPYIGTITVNTGYYYNVVQNPIPDAKAVTLLQQMANAGNGQYVQFNNGANDIYQQFVPATRMLVNQLADVFVQNENAVWWDDGSFMADTDGDGLPDLIEMQLGSDPNKKDTDGNGVSDLVEYRLTGHPCRDAACAYANRATFSQCDKWRDPVTQMFSSGSNDGFNDCEKFVMGGTVNSFSSNGSLIPDFLASVNTLSILPGTANATLSDPFGDGVSNYNKLKLGLPIQVSEKTLLHFTPRSTSLTVDNQPNPNVTCYHLQVGNVALSAFNNMIKIFVVQNPATIQDKPFATTAEAQTAPNSGVATFSPSDFK